MPQYLLRERVALLVARLRVEKGDDEPAEFVEPLHRKTEQFHEDRDRKARGDGGDEFAFAAPRHLAEQPVGPLGDAGFEWLDRLRFEEGAQHLPIGPVLGRVEHLGDQLRLSRFGWVGRIPGQKDYRVPTDMSAPAPGVAT